MSGAGGQTPRGDTPETGEAPDPGGTPETGEAPDPGGTPRGAAASGEANPRRGIPWRNEKWIAAIASLIGAVAVLIPVLLGLFDREDPPAPSPGPSTSEPAAPSPGAPGQLQPVSDGTLTAALSYTPAEDPRQGEVFAFPPGSLAQSSWPNQLVRIDAFAREHGGIPAGSTAVEMILRTSSAEPVVIRQVAARVVERRNLAPLEYLVRNPYECGPLAVREASFDLDADPPGATYREDVGLDVAEERGSLVLSVSRDQPEVISVVGSARDHDVLWEIVVFYELASEQRELVVRADGEPFRVTGAPEDIGVWSYEQGRGLTQRQPPGDSRTEPFTFC